MRRATLLVLALLLALPAQAARQSRRAAAEQGGDFGDALRELWDRLRGPRPAPAAPPRSDGTAGRIVSWNVQTLGRKASAAKKSALRAGLVSAIGRADAPVVLAAQEIANDDGAETLARLLPGEGRGWRISFEDTANAQDNGLYFGPGIHIDCERTLSIEGVEHPPRMAHLSVGQADFTLLSVHLTYAKGDARASIDELTAILAWARAAAAKPGADPDFIIAGDFNLPSLKGKALSARAGDRSWTALDESTGEDFTTLVDEPTSRSGREDTSNNYDHFLVSSDFLNEEFLAAGVVGIEEIAAAERETGGRASDHLPIALTFRTSGPGRDGRPISRDGDAICR